MGVILKDWYDKDQTFDHDTFFVRDENGEIVQFSKGAGEPTLESLEVTENGTYTPPEGVDGFSSVMVAIESILENPELRAVGGDVSTFASGQYVTINHGLGVIPDIIIIFPKAGVSVLSTSYVYQSCALKGDFATKLGLTKTGMCLGSAYSSKDLYASSSDTHDVMTTTSNAKFPWGATETSFNTPYSLNPNSSYSWIAMGKIGPTLQDKTITANGIYTADNGFDGLNKVTVNVESGNMLETPLEKNGTFTTTDAQASVTVEHGLGVVPDCVVVVGLTKEENMLCYMCGFRNGIPHPPNFQEFVRNTSKGLFRGGFNVSIDGDFDKWGSISECNEQTFKIGGTACQLDTSIEYTWYAVRHTT